MRSLSLVACMAGALAGATAVSEGISAATQQGSFTAGRPALDAIRHAVVSRMGSRAEVTVLTMDPVAPGLFREARPDPAAVLGKPIRFTLVPERGAAIPLVATLDVVADHATARQPIGRGHTLMAEDVEPRRALLSGVPLRPLATAAMLTGGRALRPIAGGAVVLTTFVAMRRAIEPGDRVMVVAVSGPVEVSATFLAADGGPVGATIRVLNPETRKLIRGRIVGDGLVEVMHGR